MKREPIICRYRDHYKRSKIRAVLVSPVQATSRHNRPFTLAGPGFEKAERGSKKRTDSGHTKYEDRCPSGWGLSGA